LPGQTIDLQLRIGDPIEGSVAAIKSQVASGYGLPGNQRDLDLAQKTYNMNRFVRAQAARISFQRAEAIWPRPTRASRGEGVARLGIDPKEAVRTEVCGLWFRCGRHGREPHRAQSYSGQFVQADSTALLTIADLSTVWVMVDVFGAISTWYVSDKSTIVATAYRPPFNASVQRIGDKVDPDSRTLRVRFAGINPNGLLKPEMFITASLELSGSGTAMSVPAGSVHTGRQGYVFAAIGDRRFERRLIAAAPDGRAA
jgi:hypothetical protein